MNSKTFNEALKAAFAAGRNSANVVDEAEAFEAWRENWANEPPKT